MRSSGNVSEAIGGADRERRERELRELREELVEERARIVAEQRWARRPETDRAALDASQPSRGRRLGEIERALELLAYGQYGACVCCGQPISTARLRTAPDAQLCCRCVHSELRPGRVGS
jgi:RNA polymerase-binding transcription factor DksA